MGFGLFAISLIFFFTPNLDIIDVLPDFIGAILVIRGLNKLSDLTPGLSDTKHAFYHVLYIGLAKFVLMFFVPYFNRNDAGYILIFTFTFAVLEMIFLLPAYRKLLDSILYLGDRTENSAVFKGRSEFFSFTSIFFIARSLLAVIPELSYIMSDEASGIVSSYNPRNIANYKNVLILFNFIIVGILGLIWLILGIRYFNGIRNDRIFIRDVTEHYEEIMQNRKGILIYRRLHFAFVLIIVGAIFLFDLISEKLDLLPDFAGGALFVIAGYLMLRHVKTKYLTLSAAVYTLLSAGYWGWSLYFAENYQNVNLFSNIRANDMFIGISSLHALSCVALGVFLYLFYKALNDVIDEHTGSSFEELSSVRARLNEENSIMKHQNTTALVLGLVSCAVSAARVFLLYELSVFWMADVVVRIIWLYVFIDLIDSVSYSMEYKYL